MEEIWKPINGYGNYMISSKGRVKSTFGKIRKLHSNHKGYCKISIMGDDGIRKTLSVHRLVAETFIPNPYNLPQVNHKNTIKTDNDINNLEWCDNSHNQKHAFKNGLQNNKGENNPRSILTINDVVNIRSSVDKSYSKLAIEYGVSKSTISSIIKNKIWTNI